MSEAGQEAPIPGLRASEEQEVLTVSSVNLQPRGAGYGR